MSAGRGRVEFQAEVIDCIQGVKAAISLGIVNLETNVALVKQAHAWGLRCLGGESTRGASVLGACKFHFLCLLSSDFQRM